MDLFKLTGKVAIVTGGSKGIGKAICEGYGEAGAKVVVVSRTKKLIEETAEQIIKNGGEAIAIPADVTSREAMEQVLKGTIDKFGRVDIMVNNAGIAPTTRAIDVTDEEWDDTFATNLKSMLITARIMGPKMIEQKGGKFINIGSVLGIMGSQNAASYCSAKGAVVQLTKVLALEWAYCNINVNCIAPGYIATEMVEFHTDALRKWLRGRIPLKRYGTTPEIVGPALFMASEASNYMTGQTMYVDGGYTAW